MPICPSVADSVVIVCVISAAIMDIMDPSRAIMEANPLVYQTFEIDCAASPW